MATKEEEEEEWRKLCQPLAEERDPRRLSELVDQLIEKLDARKQLLPNSGQQQKPASGSTTDDN
jgi:hypothetical protein